MDGFSTPVTRVGVKELPRVKASLSLRRSMSGTGVLIFFFDAADHVNLAV